MYCSWIYCLQVHKMLAFATLLPSWNLWWIYSWHLTHFVPRFDISPYIPGNQEKTFWFPSLTVSFPKFLLNLIVKAHTNFWVIAPVYGRSEFFPRKKSESGKSFFLTRIPSSTEITLLSTIVNYSLLEPIFKKKKFKTNFKAILKVGNEKRPVILELEWPLEKQRWEFYSTDVELCHVIQFP